MLTMGIKSLQEETKDLLISRVCFRRKEQFRSVCDDDPNDESPYQYEQSSHEEIIFPERDAREGQSKCRKDPGPNSTDSERNGADTHQSGARSLHVSILSSVDADVEVRLEAMVRGRQ
jgi:hypothetical protein